MAKEFKHYKCMCGEAFGWASEDFKDCQGCSSCMTTVTTGEEKQKPLSEHKLETISSHCMKCKHCGIKIKIEDGSYTD